MPIALAASSKGTNASSLSQATLAVATQTSGSLIIACEVFTAGMATFSTLIDSNSNVYALIGSQQAFAPGGSSGGARMHYKENAVGSAAHTATFTNTGTATAITVLLAEFTGVMTSGSLDTNGQANDTASPFTANITPSTGNRVLVALFGGNSGSNPATHAESSGFTVIANANETNGSSFWTCCLAYRLATGNGVTVFTPSFTETGGTDTAVIVASFIEAPGASIAWVRA